MKFISYKILFIFFCAKLNMAEAKNVDFTLYGASGKPEELEETVFTDACKAHANWEVHALVSEMTAPASTSDSMQKKKKSQSDFSIHTIEQQVRQAIGNGNVNQLPSSTTDVGRVQAAILSAARGLQAGDQFMLTIAAHGMSPNCRAEANSAIEQGIKDYTQCKLLIGVQLPGHADQIQLEAKDLIGVLKEVQKNKVKVAVDIKSCYSGAAIHDFAQAGICAHAFSTPDTVLQGCDNEKDADGIADTAAMDSTGAAFCSPGPLEKSLPPSLRAIADPDKLACYKSAKKIADTVRTSSHSLSSIYDQLRAKDKTPNQPISSDGPYWVIGNLGVLGATATAVGPQANSQCFNDSHSLISTLADNIDQIGQSVTNCKLKPVVIRILEGHEADLKKYFNDFKKLNEDTIAHAQALLGAVPGGYKTLKDIEPDVVREFISELQSARAKKNLPPMTSEDIANHTKAITDDIVGFFSDDLLTERFDLPEMRILMQKTGLNLEGLQQISSKLKFSVKEQNHDIPKVQKDLLGPIHNVERELYDKLKASPEYKKCVAEKPELYNANIACKDFQIP